MQNLFQSSKAGKCENKTTNDMLNETIILSILEVCESVEYNQLADYCCIIKGTLFGAQNAL